MMHAKSRFRLGGVKLSIFVLIIDYKGLGAATPEEIALSIMSQIVALRRGGKATPLMHNTAPETASEADAAAEKVVIRKCDI
jgi:hypothetical protein